MNKEKEIVDYEVESIIRPSVQRILADVFQKTVLFKDNSGLKNIIVRVSSGKCCELCTKIAGEYIVGVDDINNAHGTGVSVYFRHNKCDCLVTYHSDKGIQNVHTREWYSGEGYLERLKQFSLIAHRKFDRIKIPKELQLPNILIKKSVGAMAKNYDIMDLETGEVYHIVPGTYIQNRTVFAGKGVSTVFRKAEKYAKKYGGNVEDWQHCKGIALLDMGYEQRLAEIHWVQCPGIGSFEYFIKDMLDE